MVSDVAVTHIPLSAYPQAPYNPSEQYPEYPFVGAVDPQLNHVYDGVRDLFHKLNLDRENYKTPQWNPLGDFIRPGMTVVLKPNFVVSKTSKCLFATITHPSVIRAVLDYVYIALKKTGRIIIADAPQYDCNWDDLSEAVGFKDLKGFYRRRVNYSVEIYDLRSYWSPGKHFKSLLKALPGDPKGSIDIDLADKSLFHGRSTEKIYGACYDRKETQKFHDGKSNIYQLSKTVMDADVIISIPKMKVHKKVGVTLNVKNLVGICTNKNCLAHYTLSTPKNGGDQYPDDFLTFTEKTLIGLERWMYDNFLMPKSGILESIHRSVYFLHNHSTKRFIKVQEWKRQIDTGNWYGNDTAWRMAIDLLKAFNTKPHKIFTVIDGIVGGSNNGPLNPDPKFSMTLIGSRDWIAADVVAARLMGFDPKKIPIYEYLFKKGLWSVETINVISNSIWLDCLKNTKDKYLDFEPHPGWAEHIEIKEL